MGVYAQEAPAFPGAEGFARYTTTGGRGGNVIHVTNLNDSGTGSLRDAVNSTSKKIIVFDVSGVIELKSELVIKSNTTILGQTAPGEGITLRYYTLRPKGDNIIIRFIRCRRGQEVDVNDGADAIWARNYNNIILDHCSFSWSIDEVASFYDNRNFTMQWCTIGEALHNAGHGKDEHGFGGIWGGKGASFHHNLLCHMQNRTPRFNGARYGWDGYDKSEYENTVQAERVDFRNCVMFNWGKGNGCYGGPGGGYINMVNNYYKSGPSTKNKNRVTQCTLANKSNSDSSHPEFYGLYSRYYVKGNYVNGYGADYDWKGVSTDNGKFECTDTLGFYGQGKGATIQIKLTEEVQMAPVTTHTAVNAYEKVCAYAGASLAKDMVDERYAEEVASGKATYTGSITKQAGLIDLVSDQGAYSVRTQGESRPAGFDTDNDGIPDEWETANGLNPNDASDAALYTIDKKGYYTNIEVYANSLVEHIVKAQNADAESAVEEYYPEYVPTAINGISRDIAEGEAVFYNMNGVRVGSPEEKGCYIKVMKDGKGSYSATKFVQK
ncbi:MAG: pectate lyase [Bacteroidaceae bacterium]|nr:pectate lyase [Bacteroidaceae bacterium]